MPIFQVRVITADGLKERRSLDAQSKEEVQSKLLAEGVFVVSIHNSDRFYALKSRQKFDTVIFVHELKTLLDSGLSLTESFDVLLDHRRQSVEFDTLIQIRQKSQ